MTTNPTSVIDESAFSVRRTIRIAAPVEKVWTAVTEPAHISKWFGQATFTGSGVGATGTLAWPGHVSPVRVEAMDAPRMVAYRWSNDDALGERPTQVDDAASTVFTFTLEEVPGGTSLTVVETGFDVLSDPAADLKSHSEGWNSELDKLVTLLESTS
ncbi:SRPBCC domain-containing protein [Nakamurella panacisegetis]|nr:SRPBCC domain-containing protein [Nakamurella panacisegetis]